ncbi:M28 family peptidase, partial [bacterium]|nr:M28 family peptidase [bacterium]
MPKRPVMLVAASLLLALPAMASIHLVPGATTADVAPGRASRALPTWQLETGVLVLDRSGGAARLPERAIELTPRHDDGAFFLVGGRHDHDLADLAELGHVHLEADGLAVIEVPRDRLDRFLAAGHDVQYLDRSPLAPARTEPDGAPAPASRSVDPAVKAAYLDGLAQDAFDQVIREISGDLSFWHDGQPRTVRTRFYNTTGNDIVTDYLAQRLASWGYTVELDTFTAWGQVCRNVVATVEGTVTPDEIVVVGGHFDSTSGDAQSEAPGAEDNASGTSLVMELARASAGREFERTVQFVLFDA